MPESVIVGDVQDMAIDDRFGFGFTIREPSNYRNITSFMFRSREDAIKARSALEDALKTVIAVKLT